MDMGLGRRQLKRNSVHTQKTQLKREEETRSKVM